jgi:hypothetical protein
MEIKYPATVIKILRLQHKLLPRQHSVFALLKQCLQLIKLLLGKSIKVRPWIFTLKDKNLYSSFSAAPTC